MEGLLGEASGADRRQVSDRGAQGMGRMREEVGLLTGTVGSEGRWPAAERREGGGAHGRRRQRGAGKEKAEVRGSGPAGEAEALGEGCEFGGKQWGGVPGERQRIGKGWGLKGGQGDGRGKGRLRGRRPWESEGGAWRAEEKQGSERGGLGSDQFERR